MHSARLLVSRSACGDVGYFCLLFVIILEKYCGTVVLCLSLSSNDDDDDADDDDDDDDDDVQSQRTQCHVHPDSEVRQILSPRTTMSKGRHQGSTGHLRDPVSPGRFALVYSGV